MYKLYRYISYISYIDIELDGGRKPTSVAALYRWLLWCYPRCFLGSRVTRVRRSDAPRPAGYTRKPHKKPSRTVAAGVKMSPLAMGRFILTLPRHMILTNFNVTMMFFGIMIVRWYRWLLMKIQDPITPSLPLEDELWKESTYLFCLIWDLGKNLGYVSYVQIIFDIFWSSECLGMAGFICIRDIHDPVIDCLGSLMISRMFGILSSFHPKHGSSPVNDAQF